VQNELTLRQIVDGISAPLAVMTPDGTLEIVNRPILEYFGKTAEELKEWTSTDAVHPDDLPRVLSAWRHSIDSGQPFTDEHRQRRSDGADVVPRARASDGASCKRISMSESVRSKRSVRVNVSSANSSTAFPE
jgi:PAS domain S-box-containing protein